MTNDHPDIQQLADLAREGRRELRPLGSDHRDQLWAGIEAHLDDVVTTDPTSASRSSRSMTSWWPLSAVAAAALVVGLALGGAWSRPTESDPVTVATIELAPLTDAVTPATAALRQGAEGRTIAVDLADLPSTDGFHEVWLLDPDTGALVSLGPVRADGTYVVPDTVDLVELPVLDVSTEPRDGDPGHSGDSLLRGDVTWLG